jgi:Putative  PD-(D/E)XK family member, (DUF4420)
MAALRHMSWDNFRTTVLISGQQRVHRVTESPLIELFSDGAMNRIGILIESTGTTTIPPDLDRLTFINARTVTRPGRLFLEISTSATALYRQFYHFAVAVAERVTVDRLPPSEAVALELKCFTDLLAEKAILGIERQIGLIGELLFLERLIVKLGSSALSAWLGPLGEPHDFRLQSREFEVKTTVSPQRVHIINGTEQLLPSAGCSLSLISILLGPPGAAAGVSLSDKVAQLSAQLMSAPLLKSQFDTALEASGFRTEDSEQYTRQFILRRPMGIVPVGKAFPAVTRRTIQDALGEMASRIESLQYEVNVEGLEQEDGTAEFELAISS